MTQALRDHAARSRNIIAANRYMTLATAADGEVWVAPVAYAFDEAFDFFWYSAREATHSRHIQSKTQVAVAIFDSRSPSDTADGVQMAGVASEVAPEDLDGILDLYFRQSFPDAEARMRWQRPRADFTGAAPQRFYRFRPGRVFVCDPESTLVDRRVEVSSLADRATRR